MTYEPFIRGGGWNATIIGRDPTAADLDSIEVGKLADMVIIEKNLFDVPSDKNADTKILGTIMDGNFNYRDGL